MYFFKFKFLQRYLQGAVFIALFIYFIFGCQFFVDIIEQAIDKLAALNGAVILGQVNIFINGNLGRDGFKK